MDFASLQTILGRILACLASGHGAGSPEWGPPRGGHQPVMHERRDSRESGRLSREEAPPSRGKERRDVLPMGMAGGMGGAKVPRTPPLAAAEAPEPAPETERESFDAENHPLAGVPNVEAGRVRRGGPVATGLEPARTAARQLEEGRVARSTEADTAACRCLGAPKALFGQAKGHSCAVLGGGAFGGAVRRVRRPMRLLEGQASR